MGWHALQVLTGKENDIADLLREHGVTAIAPVRIMLERRSGKWTEARRVAMPGYVFVRCKEMTVPLYYRLTRENGVIAMLGREGSAFHSIPDEQVKIIRALADGAQGISHGARDAIGNVMVTDGPLATMERDIVRFDIRRKRATVRVTLYGDSYEVDMALEIQAAEERA